MELPGPDDPEIGLVLGKLLLALVVLTLYTVINLANDPGACGYNSDISISMRNLIMFKKKKKIFDTGNFESDIGIFQVIKLQCKTDVKNRQNKNWRVQNILACNVGTLRKKLEQRREKKS